MIPIVSQMLIEAYAEASSRDHDASNAILDRFNLLQEDQPVLHDHLIESIKVMDEKFGQEASANALDLLCYMYALLKRQDEINNSWTS